LTLRQRPSINENSTLKSKIATPKGPEAFRRDPNLRCAMKVGYPELGGALGPSISFKASRVVEAAGTFFPSENPTVHTSMA
jgi:hypothetical protein